MQLTVYEWIYIIIDIFGTYVIYRYMKVFFEQQRSSKKVELLTYIIYYIFITGIFLFVNIPVILMICNISAFIALSYNYESTLKKRVLSILMIYLILVCIETGVVLASSHIDLFIFSVNQYSSIYGLVACKILSYVVVLILKNFNNLKRGESVPNSNWICIILIPLTSLYMILLLFHAEGLTGGQLLVAIMLLLLINFATFYLYDKIIVSLSEKMHVLLALEQNKYYDTQLNLMRDSLQSIRIFRHDLKNHIFSIYSLLEKGDREEALAYISSVMEDIGSKQDYAASGNTIIDSIINFKLQHAEQNRIKTTVDLCIPEEMNIPSFDLTIIFGNLIDNAIEAALKEKENRFIDIRIKYDKGRLLIKIDNSFAGEIMEGKERILTTKDNKEYHGIGLESVKKVIQKYDGMMNLDYSGNIFSASVMIFPE